MRTIWNEVERSRDGWLKDVAALASIGAFVWVVGTWSEIAQNLIG